ncbi:hypothetical protein [Pseudomonas amygdali]|uniref:Uncharacterized protein n=2 Tax=Pseudomonas amygdali pv. lachrymans TaxID=53707 RepID=A0ABR5KTR9_PSEAV|nr:hypothetical protein [Pseudomonas amygdali]AXH59524.1 hypothetical protein PLA107_030320 [Pseudomonas amygdali pv. lachrymans str. M301315]KPC16952.1 Uncharacterized protein AC499_0154 [Pseudomonas amygdali pv. lachrymans]KPC17911.1 Uncharacterized protein AC499_1113 [Pseudomonas amygdali pv. lachrymans]RMT05916.1 hypothetical protein ALP54_102358 [Pseudomonas amygdali pv. lachrymans]
MKLILCTALYIVCLGIFGPLTAQALMGTPLNGSSVLGALLVPLALLVFKTRRANGVGSPL